MKKARSPLIQQEMNKQFRYALVNVIFVFAIILIINSFSLFMVFEFSNYCRESAGTSDIAEIAHRVQVITISTGISILASGGLCFIYILYLTHRFLGPTVAINRHLEKMLEGDYSNRIHLRKKDELQEVAGKLNQLSEMLDKKNSKAGDSH